MTWYDQIFAHAAWIEFARIFPREAENYRQFPGQARYLRPMVEDFFKAYEGR
jgi:hypothetical protein